MSEARAPHSPEALTLDRLRQVVDVLEEGVAILDADGVVEFINPSGERILRVSAGELIGWSLTEFRWTLFDTAGRPIPREDHPSLKVLRTGKPHPPVVLGMTSPAVPEPVWIEVSARPLQSEGEDRPHASVTTFRDVSARIASEKALRASERRYHTLVTFVPVGIFHTDQSGACLYVNDAWTRITGMSAEDAIGDGWMCAVHPEDVERVRERWVEAAERGESFRAEYRLTRPDGEVRWVAGSAIQYVGGDDAPVGFMGSITDITDARRAVELKDQIIGLVSHELRAPLIAIRGGLTFLASHMERANGEDRRFYDMAVRNAKLLERLLNDLLDIERLEGGEAPLSMEEVALSRLLDEARDLALPMAHERDIIVAPAPQADRVLSVDPDRILQVLANLLSNAVKFSEPEGRVWMDVVDEREAVVIGVHDQGRGIPEEYLERVFDRFGQVRASDASERGGVGLGLAIARAIISRHGGRIWVESAPGKGSSFYFRIPA